MKKPARKLHAHHFYAHEFDKKYHNLEFLFIALLPFLSEIYELFFATFLYSHGTIKVQDEDVVMFRTIAAVLIFPYLVWKKQNKLTSDTAFWFALAALPMQLLMDVALLASRNKDILEILDFFRSCFVGVIIIFFLFFDNKISQGLKRILYKDAPTNKGGDNLAIVQSTNSFDKEKILHFLNVVVGSTAGILITVSVIKIFFDQVLPSVNTESKNNASLQEVFKVNLAALLFNAVLFAPLYEEIIYRQAIMNFGKGSRLSVFISAFVFALIHLNNEPLWIMTFYIVPGIIFGCIYRKYKNIWFTIAIHFLYNSVSILGWYINS